VKSKPHYRIIVDRVNNLDTLELQVEVDEEFSRIRSASYRTFGASFRKILKLNRTWHKGDTG